MKKLMTLVFAAMVALTLSLPAMAQATKAAPAAQTKAPAKKTSADDKKAADKKQAIKDILEIKDVKQFLRESGYERSSTAVGHNWVAKTTRVYETSKSTTEIRVSWRMNK